MSFIHLENPENRFILLLLKLTDHIDFLTLASIPLILTTYLAPNKFSNSRFNLIGWPIHSTSKH